MDIKQEMIEDTGLKCPWCNYNLTAVRSNECPECGKRFVLHRPGDNEVEDISFKYITSNSLLCKECGHYNQSFMPKQCSKCGNPFTLYERIFGHRNK